MGQYVELPGIKTWYDVDGAGDPLLLLHGGMCTNDTWEPQLSDFAARFKVYLPERRAHGHTPDVAGPLTYDDMAADTIAFIETVVGSPAHLVGWSDGAIVALLVAIARPDLVRKMVVIGANFAPASAIPESAGMLDDLTPDNPDLDMFRSMYEAASPDGAEHWPVVVEKLVELYRKEPNISAEQLGRIAAHTLVLIGDDDMVGLDHTTALFRAIPVANAELAVVPGASHALLMEKPQLVNRLMLDFLENDPSPTMFPIRRAAATPA